MRDDQLLRLTAGNPLYKPREVNYESGRTPMASDTLARLEFFAVKVGGLEVGGCNLLPELRERAVAAARKPNYTELRVTKLNPE